MEILVEGEYEDQQKGVSWSWGVKRDPQVCMGRLDSETCPLERLYKDVKNTWEEPSQTLVLKGQVHGK